MKDIYFYLTLVFIGIISPLIIYSLNELLFVLSLDISISFFSFIADNLSLSSKSLTIMPNIHIIVTYAIAALLVFIPIYYFLDLDIEHNKKSISIITTISIIFFAYFALYTSEVFFDDLLIYYDLTALMTIIVINLFIILRLSKKSNLNSFPLS